MKEEMKKIEMAVDDVEKMSETPIEKPSEEPGRGAKKTRRFNMVMTESAYQDLLDYAKDSKTVSAYILESCLSDKKRPYQMTSEVLKALVKTQTELNRIGNNINQTTKHIHFLMHNQLINAEVITRYQNDMRQYTSALIALEERLAKFMKP